VRDRSDVPIKHLPAVSACLQIQRKGFDDYVKVARGQPAPSPRAFEEIFDPSET
jgi:hypothetical protein